MVVFLRFSAEELGKGCKSYSKATLRLIGLVSIVAFVLVKARRAYLELQFRKDCCMLSELVSIRKSETFNLNCQARVS